MINQARIYVPKERRKSQHSWGHPHSTTTSSSSRTPLLQTLRRKALTSKEKRSRRPCCFLLLPPFPPSSFRLVLQSPTGISPGAPNRLRRARGPVVVARPFEALRLIVLSRQQFFSPLLLDVSLTAALASAGTREPANVLFEFQNDDDDNASSLPNPPLTKTNCPFNHTALTSHCVCWFLSTCTLYPFRPLLV